MAAPVYSMAQSYGQAKKGGIIYPPKPLIKFLHQYGSKTKTLPDGTRQLVDQGTGKANADLHSGHGAYFNGVDNTFTVNLVAGSFFYYKDGSFVHEEITTPEVRVISAGGIYKDLYNTPGVVFTANQLLQHQVSPERTLYWDNGVLKSDILDQATIDSMQAGNGFWCPLSESVSADGYYRDHALPMPGNLAANGDFSDGLNGWFDGDGYWTSSDGRAYLDNSINPALFRPLVSTTSLSPSTQYILEVDVEIINGEVKFLMSSSPTNTTDIVQSSDWEATESGTYRFKMYTDTSRIYLGVARNNSGQLTEAYVDNIKVYPLANSGLSELTNWQTTNATNAQALQYGTQSLLNPSDEFGLQSGVGKPGELYGDNRSYADTHDIRLDGDWCVDLFADTQGNIADQYDRFIGVTARDTSGTELDDITVLVNTGSNKLVVNMMSSYHTSTVESGVVTIERIGTTLNAYLNGTLVKTATGKVFDHILLHALLVNEGLSYGYTYGVLGTLQITEGTRTDEQRTKDVQKLATKHGVTL